MFGKYFASTFTGSMYGAGPVVFAVWGYAIANAVASQVELNPVFLASVLGADLASVEQAIAYLCAPDPNSRTKGHDGRRLVREGQFAYFVPNHNAYRQIRHEDDRREYNRVKKAEQRERERGSSDVNTPVIDTPPSQDASTRQSNMSAKAVASASASVSGSCSVVEGGVGETKLPPGALEIIGFMPEVYRGEVEGAFRAHRNPGSLVAEFDALNQGMHGKPQQWATIGRAVHEMAVAGATMTSRALRAFCEGTVPLAKGNGAKLGKIEQGRANLAEWAERERAKEAAEAESVPFEVVPADEGNDDGPAAFPGGF